MDYRDIIRTPARRRPLWGLQTFASLWAVEALEPPGGQALPDPQVPASQPPPRIGYLLVSNQYWLQAAGPQGLYASRASPTKGFSGDRAPTPSFQEPSKGLQRPRGL